MERKLSRRDFNKQLVSVATAFSLGIAGFTKSAFAGSNRVLIIGGGFGGATAAKYLRKLDPSLSVTLIEPKAVFYTGPLSNWVLAGLKTMQDIAQHYTTLKNRYNVTVIPDTAVSIDAVKKEVKLKSGKVLSYDRLIVSPGIDFTWDTIEGYSEKVAEHIMPHGFQGGSQILLLRQQLLALKDGSNVLICPPVNSFRCPASPYERASLIAMYLKKNKPKSKVIILDHKEKFSMQELFMQGWERLYPGMIVLRAATAGGNIEKVDAASILKFHTEWSVPNPQSFGARIHSSTHLETTTTHIQKHSVHKERFASPVSSNYCGNPKDAQCSQFQAFPLLVAWGSRQLLR